VLWNMSFFDRELVARMHRERGRRSLARQSISLLRGADRRGRNDDRL